MTVDLSVIESLGINLYSNAAAVLSELVANAYDADAALVEIAWRNDGDRIIVADDGNGMDQQELNERFLKVGYKKRKAEGTESPRWKRPYMGRKGIGKLSVFSLAQLVSVYSTKDDKSHGLVIDVERLEADIRAGRDHHPPPVEVPSEFARPGTVIVLEQLKRKRADLTASALRKRLARRFDVLDQPPADQGGFYIEINGKRVTFADRQELKRLEFVWEFGSAHLPEEALPPGVTRFVLPKTVVNEEEAWVVRGWIGTAHRPTDLTEDREAGSLKNIIVLARKRPIQEGIIDKLDFSRIFGNYVTGQIEADFLDLDSREDIATSDRQRLMEDDERVVALQAFLREAFLKAANDWSEARPKKAAEDALTRYPQLKEWVDARPSWQRGAARKMIGTIAGLPLGERSEGQARSDLLRAGILAFERLGLRNVAEDLERLSEVTSSELLRLLGAQDVYEAALWADILRSRVEAIGQFRNLTRADEKERVLQRHLFDHLYLLDASWERATGDQRMEEDLRKVDPGIFATDANGDPITGRIDIRYATTSGKHVIVELKRYSVTPTLEELEEQGMKYYTALQSLLRKRNRDGQPIEVVFVLGDHPRVKRSGRMSEGDYIASKFAPMNGRYALYDELIANAERQYADYLAASQTAHELDALLESLKDVDV